jgi:hypothetical protein
MLPVGAVSSQTWRGRDDAGRTAVLREVPEGQSPVVSTSVFPGIVPLREVTVIDGRRYGVWAFVEAESLQDACERLAELGRTVPLAVLVRVVVDASRALVSVTPGRPHGGLSDASLLIGADGAVQVMDFGAPRPSRFTPRGPPSFGNDVFALGAVLHAALTGFGGSYADAVDEGLSLPAPSQLRDDCTPAIDDVILRAIARTIEARQPDLELLADELEAVLGEALATRDQVAEALYGPTPSAPPVPEVDPGPALGAEDDAPTGRHELPGVRETIDGLAPVSSMRSRSRSDLPARDGAPSRPPAGIPMGTQPGGPARDEGPVSVASRPPVTVRAPSRPPAGIPMGTQPGGPPRDDGDAGVPSRAPAVVLTGPQPSAPGRDGAPGMRAVGAATSPQPGSPTRDESPAGGPSKPFAGIPMGTQPGGPPRDAFVSVAEPAPALDEAPPDATQPRAVIPRAMTSRPSRPAAPVPVPVDTQPRIPRPVPDTAENEVPTGATPTPGAAPASTAMSHAKLEWAATQTRVSTPPVGVPALGDEVEAEPTNARARMPALGDEDEPEPTNVRARVPPTSGTAPVLDSVPSLEAPAPSASELPAASGRGRRVVIAVLLVVVAGLFGAFAWKKQSGGDVVVEQVVIGEDDAGLEAPVGDAGAEALLEVDAGDEAEEALDAGDETPDVEADSGVELEPEDAGASDAGASDAGVKKSAKQKPVKKKRRR